MKKTSFLMSYCLQLQSVLILMTLAHALTSETSTSSAVTTLAATSPAAAAVVLLDPVAPDERRHGIKARKGVSQILTPDDDASSQLHAAVLVRQHLATSAAKDTITFMTQPVTTTTSPNLIPLKFVTQTTTSKPVMPTPATRQEKKQKMTNPESSGDRNVTSSSPPVLIRGPEVLVDHKQQQQEKDVRQDRLSEEYYHLLIGLCFGLVLLIYVLIHITVSVHDMMKRKRYRRSGFDTRHLIDEVQGLEEDEP